MTSSPLGQPKCLIRHRHVVRVEVARCRTRDGGNSSPKRSLVLYPEAVLVEIGIRRIDKGVTRVSSSSLEDERRLEDAIEEDISILGLDNLLILGRLVYTAHSKKINILAIDGDGVLYVIELKKDRTPREVVSQALDYGSWDFRQTKRQNATPSPSLWLVRAWPFLSQSR
jgi:hypothetical protein